MPERRPEPGRTSRYSVTRPSIHGPLLPGGRTFTSWLPQSLQPCWARSRSGRDAGGLPGLLRRERRVRAARRALPCGDVRAAVAVQALGAGAVRSAAARVARESRRVQVAGNELVAGVLAARVGTTARERDAERCKTSHPPALHQLFP